MSAPEDSIQPPHPIFGEINMQYLSGVVERDGKLYVILDVERIFQETAPTAQKKVAYERPPASVVAAAGTEDQELKFVCEGLATFGSFYVTELNLAWVEKRFAEWRRQRQNAGVSVQLGGEDDAREFLSTFSPRSDELWADEQRTAFLGLVPPSVSGTFVVWNHGCGRGFDAYSVVCAIKAAFPSLVVKVWANDANLLQIAAAPSLVVPTDRVPRFYVQNGFVKEAQGGCSFSTPIKECITFEYTETLARAEDMEADVIIARNVLSFMKPEAQKALLDTFAHHLDSGGMLIVGPNENVGGEEWRAVEKDGLRAFMLSQSKEDPGGERSSGFKE